MALSKDKIELHDQKWHMIRIMTMLYLHVYCKRTLTFSVVYLFSESPNKRKIQADVADSCFNYPVLFSFFFFFFFFCHVFFKY